MFEHCPRGPAAKIPHGYAVFFMPKKEVVEVVRIFHDILSV